MKKKKVLSLMVAVVMTITTPQMAYAAADELNDPNFMGGGVFI